MLCWPRFLKKKKDLSFEDAGCIRDEMDRKAETPLRKAWDAGAAAMRPDMDSTCVARSMDLCLTQ